jgi:hypothetical protein
VLFVGSIMELNAIANKDLDSVTGGHATPEVRQLCTSLDRQGNDTALPAAKRIQLLQDATTCWLKAAGS